MKWRTSKWNGKCQKKLICIKKRNKSGKKKDKIRVHLTTCGNATHIRERWRCANVLKWEGYRPTNMWAPTPPFIRQITRNYFDHQNQGNNRKHGVQRSETWDGSTIWEDKFRWEDVTSVYCGAKVTQHSKYADDRSWWNCNDSHGWSRWAVLGNNLGIWF